jgi:hypothetical protein
MTIEIIKMKNPLLTILTEESDFDRQWCGNDETGHFTWHDRIPTNPDPVSIRLSWKSNHGAPIQHIGTFKLYLSTLITHDYIKTDNPGYVRVKFINDNGLIKLSRGFFHPFLIVGVRLL